MSAAITEGAVQDRTAAARRFWEARSPLASDFAKEMRTAIEWALRERSLQFQAVTARVKDCESFVDKGLRESPTHRGVFKYDDPLQGITDFVGVRVVTYLSTSVDLIIKQVQSSFGDVEEQQVRVDDDGVPGYAGRHVLAGLGEKHLALPMYTAYTGLRAEIQVQTILQHAWAEMQHDISYKSNEPPPPGIRRRLTGLAGLLELADREFVLVGQELETAHVAETEAQVDEPLDQRGLEGGAVRALLLRQLPGLAEPSVEGVTHLVEVLMEIGFENLGEVDTIVARHRDKAARVLAFLREEGYEPGSVEVADALLRLELGERYLHKRSAWALLDAHRQGSAEQRLDNLRRATS